MNLFRLILSLKLVSSRIVLLDIMIAFNLIITNVEICLAFNFAHLGITLSQSLRIFILLIWTSSGYLKVLEFFLLPNRGTTCFVPNTVINAITVTFIFSYTKFVCLPICLSGISLHSQKNSLKIWRPKQVLYFTMLTLDSGETLLYCIF